MNLLFLFCGKKLGASLGRGLLFKAGIPNLEGLILESTKFGQWLLKVYCGIFKLKLLFPPSRLFTSTLECVWVVTVGRKYDVSKELNLETIRAVLFHSLPVILFLLTIDATCAATIHWWLHWAGHSQCPPSKKGARFRKNQSSGKVLSRFLPIESLVVL